MCQYDKADKRYKERDRAKNALQAIEIALWHEEGKNNGFKLNNFKNKTHTLKKQPSKAYAGVQLTLTYEKTS